MKKIFSLLATAVLLSCTAQAQYENTKIQVGQAAPDLSYSNPQGQVLSLKKTNKGRYILLDFWASWCRPCRMANPQVVAAYNKYKEKKFRNAPAGFTVFSVSLDANKDAWTQAIAADGLVWENHVSDLKKWDSEAAAIYGIQFIPQTFLLGPDGRVLGKYADVLQAIADLDKYVDNGDAAVKKKTVTKGKATTKI